MPKSLDETYKRVLKDINNANRVHAYRLLQCLAVTSRPLRVEELAEVLAFDFTGGIPKSISNWRWEDREEAVLSACSSLVSVISTKGSRVVQFSHFSVKEFLTSDRLTSCMEDVSRFHIPIEPSHAILAQACLGTLLRLDDHSNKSSVQKIPLFRYAAEYWHQHAQIGNVELEIANALDCFFDTNKPHFPAWVRLQGRTNLGITGTPFSTPIDVPVPVAPLCFAAGKGLRSLVERITTKHPLLVNQVDCTFGSPLHATVYGGGHIEVAQFLFDHGANINSRTVFNNTPLHIASRHGHLKIGKWLLDHGADVNFPKYNGITPLSEASAYGHFEFAQILLEYNADTNSRDDEGSTPLHWALRNGKLNVVQLLLDHGANVHLRYQSGKTPLHFAAAGGHLDFARKLLELDVEVNSWDDEGSTPIHCALVLGTLDVAWLLLDHGVDIHVRYKSGKTLLHFAATEGHLEFVRKLLELNAEVNSRDDEGSTPLYCALENGKPDVVQLLLNNGADVRVRVRNRNRNTLLHIAAAGGHLEVVRKLLNLNAEVNSRNDHGSTPLFLASENGHTGVLQLLLDLNADLYIHDCDGNTPLHRAAFGCQLEVARILLKHNVDVNSRNAEGSTPLHQVAERHGKARKDIVELLLDHNADVRTRNLNGQTASEALSEAIRADFWQNQNNPESFPESVEIVRLLSQHTAK